MTQYKNKKLLGFTLVELLLSVTILAFGLTSVLHSFMVMIDAMGRTEHVIAASYLLEEKMGELKLSAKGGGGITEGTTSGQFNKSDEEDEEAQASRYRWSLDVVQSTMSKSYLEATLSVHWVESNKDKELSTIAYFKNKDAE